MRIYRLFAAILFVPYLFMPSIFISCLLVSSIFVSCGSSPNTNSKESVKVRPVKVVEATRSNVVARDFVGLSTSMMSVRMAFKVSGQLLEIPVSKGTIVSEGDVLARLDPQDIETQLMADRAAFDQARSHLDRVGRLLSHEAVSQQEYERAESAYSQAKATYRNTEELLVQTTLRAPFRAIIERVYVDTYQRVQSGEAIMLLVTPTTSQVEFTLPEGSLQAMLDSTTHFEVRFDNIPDVTFSANVVEYARTSSDASGFPVTLRIESPDPERYSISSGMSCMITMYTSSASRGDVVVPLTSIYAPAEGGTYVWVVGSDGRVVRRSVSVGSPISRDEVVVSRGVDAGDRVVVAGLYQLQDGQRVRILK